MNQTRVILLGIVASHSYTIKSSVDN